MSLLAHGSAYSGSTVTLDTTGAAFIVTAEVSHGAVNSPTLADNKNTLTNLTAHGAILVEGPRHTIRISYKLAPVVGTGHQWSENVGANGSFAVLAFSDAATAFDVENHNNSTTGATTLQAGSVSPAGASSLIVAAWGIDDPANTGTPKFLADLGFSDPMLVAQDCIVGSNHGIAMAYKYVTGASAINPTLTRSNANTQSGDAAVIAVFTIPAVGGTQTPLRNPLPAFKRAFGKSSLALRPRQMPAAPGVATFAGLNVDTSQAVPIGGSVAVAVLDQVTSSQAVPVAGAASVSVAEQVTSSQSVSPGGSVTLSVLEQLTSTRAVPIGGSIALGVAVQVSSVQAVPINGAIGAAVLVQITSTQQIPIGGTISGGSGAIVTSAASVLIGGNIAVSALEQLASSIQVLLGGSATVAVRLQVTSAVPVPLAGLIAAAIGLAGSSGAAVPLNGTITISVAAPFTGTHLDEPLSIDFDALATAIDFTSLATAIDFDAIETVLVFLDGGTDVLELTILKGELTPIAMTLQGADPVTGALVPYDVAAASSVKLNAGKPGATLVINAKDLVKTDAVNGRVTYNPASPETDVAGRYDALVVATFPGPPGVVRKFPGKLTIRDAIA